VITAVIPIYHCADGAIRVIEETKGYVDRVIVVNDDDEDLISHKLKDSGVDVIRLNKNMGKGEALRRGFSRALTGKPEFIVTIDSDGEHDPSNIPELVKRIVSEGADMLITERQSMRSAFRLFLLKFADIWIRLVSRYDVGDTQSGYRVFKSSSLGKMKLQSKGFEIETEMILEAARKGFKITKMQIKPEYQHVSNYNTLKILRHNLFFDRWVLNWIKSKDCDLGKFRRFILFIYCHLGLSLSLIFGGIE
jgi:glycosyltransferase involved in cell wall biosynthesis